MTESELLKTLVEAIDAREPVVLATVVGTSRSVPRHAGSKMLIFADRRQVGTVGGGELESRVLAAATDALADGRPRQLEFDLVDPARGDPGVCGGSVSIFLEPYNPRSRVVVVGCGHVGLAVVELAHWLGYHVTAMDDRPELATTALEEAADDVLIGPLSDSMASLEIDSRTHVVLVSRNVGVDVEILPSILQSSQASIGVMGSSRRWATTRAKLEASGVDANSLDRVVSPIGLDIAAETPREIAVSILGELVDIQRLASKDLPGEPEEQR